MGNCCTVHGSAVWARDEWGPMSPERPTVTEKEGLLLRGGGESSNAVRTTTRDQVRIRISKKQLEELLRRAHNASSGGGTQKKKMRAEQILQSLIDQSDHFEIHHDHDQRSWRPVLQSIPEVN